MAAGVLALGVAALWLAARGRVFRVEVRGDSMAPTLLHGDVAVAVAVGEPTVGDVVVVGHPVRPEAELVKRVTAGPGDLASDARELGSGEYWVEGDQPARSTDSRHFGPVELDDVRARVVAVVWPPSRLRWVRRGVRS